MADDRLTITFRGEKKELFMSFKRLNQCIRAVGNGDDFQGVITDPDTSEFLLQILLAEKGQSPIEVDLDDDDLSREDFDKAVSWITEHLIGFFVTKFQEAVGRAEQLQPLKEHLQKLPQTG